MLAGENLQYLGPWCPEQHLSPVLSGSVGTRGCVCGPVGQVQASLGSLLTHLVGAGERWLGPPWEGSPEPSFT